MHLSQEREDISQDLLTAGREYDDNITDITKYFCKDARDIRNLEESAATNANLRDFQHILKRKKLIRSEYERIKRLEMRLPIRPPILFFIADCSTSIVLGITLNIGSGNSGFGIAGILIFLYQWFARSFPILSGIFGPHWKPTRRRIEEGVDYFLHRSQTALERDELELPVRNGNQN